MPGTHVLSAVSNDNNITFVRVVHDATSPAQVSGRSCIVHRVVLYANTGTRDLGEFKLLFSLIFRQWFSAYRSTYSSSRPRDS